MDPRLSFDRLALSISRAPPSRYSKGRGHELERLGLLKVIQVIDLAVGSEGMASLNLGATRDQDTHGGVVYYQVVCTLEQPIDGGVP